MVNTQSTDTNCFSDAGRNGSAVCGSKMHAITLAEDQALTLEMMNDLADPESPMVSITIPDVIPPEVCRKIAEGFRARAAQSYGGAANEDISIASGGAAWAVRYLSSASAMPNSSQNWAGYHDAAFLTDLERYEVTAPLCGDDIVTIPVNVIDLAVGNLNRAVHPRTGRPMEQCVVRQGAAGIHCDYAAKDIGIDAVGHVGMVIPLATGPNPRQRVWDHYHPFDDKGNYGFDIPPNVPFIDVPTPIGAICLLSARRTHAVLDTNERITVAFHCAPLRLGKWVYYA
jgi:hypothetical protein